MMPLPPHHPRLSPAIQVVQQHRQQVLRYRRRLANPSLMATLSEHTLRMSPRPIRIS